MSGELEISGTPGEIYERYLVPASSRVGHRICWSRQEYSRGNGCLTSPVVLAQ